MKTIRILSQMPGMFFCALAVSTSVSAQPAPTAAPEPVVAPVPVAPAVAVPAAPADEVRSVDDVLRSGTFQVAPLESNGHPFIALTSYESAWCYDHWGDSNHPGAITPAYVDCVLRHTDPRAYELCNFPNPRHRVSTAAYDTVVAPQTNPRTLNQAFSLVYGGRVLGVFYNTTTYTKSEPHIPFGNVIFSRVRCSE